jgi:hypothetical protein
MSLPDDWKIDRNEDDIEIRVIETQTEKELEDKVESDVYDILKSIGIDAKRIPRSDYKTSDYEGMGVDFEVTIVQPYTRGIAAIENMWQMLQKNIGTCYCAYVYSDSERRPVFRLLTKKESVKGLSVLCLRQHVSIYYKKIKNKIDEEYKQNTTNRNQIIVLDFRVAPFSSTSLRNEIAEVLEEIGKNYHYLLGVIFSLPKTIISSPFAEPSYFYVPNPHVSSPQELIEKLKVLESVGDDTALSIMPMLPLIVIPHTNEVHSMNSPCIECPSIDDLASQGMPVL